MFLSLIEESPEIVPKTSWKLPYKNPCIICMDSVDRLHGVSLEAGSPGEALGSLVSIFAAQGAWIVALGS